MTDLVERPVRSEDLPGDGDGVQSEQGKGDRAMNDALDGSQAGGAADQTASPRPVLAGSMWLSVVAAVLAVIALLTMYVLVQFWPATAPVGGVPPAFQYVTAFGVTLAQVSRETLFFVVVISAGALGGSVHALRSVGWYAGAAP